MKLYVGVTDNDWFRFLAARQPDEVNFWRPGGGSFRALDNLEPFLFKLHSPHDYVVGGGFFVKYSRLPLSFAWEVFGEKNGAPDYDAFYHQIRQYREPRGTMQVDPYIGCIVLASPFFFDQDDWIPVPRDWHSNIVQGKTYDTNELAGARLWEKVQTVLKSYPIQQSEEKKALAIGESRRYGDEYVVHPRLGQGGFRVSVTDAYGRRGAITGERTLPVLEASHIKPYSESGPHDVGNGILLRADLHILFDRGYITVTEDYHVEASRHLREQFDNGEEYYRMHGRLLEILPSAEEERPLPRFVEWHNQNVYKG